MAQSKAVFGNQVLLGFVCSKYFQQGLNKGNIILSCTDDKIFFFQKNLMKQKSVHMDDNSS